MASTRTAAARSPRARSRAPSAAALEALAAASDATAASLQRRSKRTRARNVARPVSETHWIVKEGATTMYVPFSASPEDWPVSDEEREALLELARNGKAPWQQQQQQPPPPQKKSKRSK